MITDAECMVEANRGLIFFVLNRKFSFLSGYNPERLDEVKHLATIGLWYAARRYDPDSGNKFSTYAIKVIEGFIKNHLSEDVRQHRLRTVSLDAPVKVKTKNEESETSLSDILEDKNWRDPFNHILDAPASEILHHAVDALPRAQRVAIEAYYFQEEEPGVTAARLGITLQSIRASRRQALRRLEQILTRWNSWTDTCN
jgi:RNA polymerase sigma factor (sigma-70 family)